MPAIILCLFRFVRLLGSGHQAVVVGNLALRLQLAVYKRKHKRPVLTQWDRMLWVGLSQVWSHWRQALIFVQPDTVVRWQRERFSQILGPTLETERAPPRKAGRRHRDPQIDPADDYRQSVVASTEN